MIVKQWVPRKKKIGDLISLFKSAVSSSWLSHWWDCSLNIKYSTWRNNNTKNNTNAPTALCSILMSCVRAFWSGLVGKDWKYILYIRNHREKYYFCISPLYFHFTVEYCLPSELDLITAMTTFHLFLWITEVWWNSCTKLMVTFTALLYRDSYCTI